MTDKTSNTEMAQDRTDWAEDRTMLANERTFAGWMRTGMASVALALGLRAVFGDFEPTWGAKSVATVFLIAAVAIFWSARNQACATYANLQDRAITLQGANRFTLLAVVFTIATGCVGGILWWL